MLKSARLAARLRYFHWELEFPQIFGAQSQGGFDIVLVNPPWERIKLQEQEHWVDVPAIANAPHKAERARRIRQWAAGDPAQVRRVAAFKQARYDHAALSRFVRGSGRFPLSAVGDTNTYALFVELARALLRQGGRAGLIVPTGIATDDSYKALFADLVRRRQLISLHDFENRRRLFPAVDSRVRFCLLTLGAAKQPPCFSFYASDPHDLADARRSFTLTEQELELISPSTLTCPVFRTPADAALTARIYRQVPLLLDERRRRNDWSLRFMRMFDMANDSSLFASGSTAGLAPLYEARLIHQFNHRWASYVEGRPRKLTAEELADPSRTIVARYYVSPEQIEAQLAGCWQRGWLLGFRDIARATDERSAIFTLLPRVAVGNKLPLLFLNDVPAQLVACFLACTNSLVFDFVTRQKLAGTTMNYYIIKQLPVPTPASFSAADVAFIAPRVLELVYTAWDLRAFAEELWAALGPQERASIIARQTATWELSGGLEVQPDRAGSLLPFGWSEPRRAAIRAELDAHIARLYGLSRDELCYLLDPAEVYGPDYPGETFRVLKEKERRRYGEYRTRRLVLEAWDAAEAEARQP